MVAKTLDLQAYGRLLSTARPQLPHTAEENERLIGMVHGLQGKAELSREETELLEVLLALIEKFENSHYSTRGAQGHDVLKELMRAHGTKPKDLYGIFGSKGTTSEVLRGKRGVSKVAAKALAERYGVSTDLFL